MPTRRAKCGRPADPPTFAGWLHGSLWLHEECHHTRHLSLHTIAPSLHTIQPTTHPTQAPTPALRTPPSSSRATSRYLPPPPINQRCKNAATASKTPPESALLIEMSPRCCNNIPIATTIHTATSPTPPPEPTSVLTFTLPYTTDSPDPTMTSDRCQIDATSPSITCVRCTPFRMAVSHVSSSPPSRAERRRREARYIENLLSLFSQKSDSRPHTLTHPSPDHTDQVLQREQLQQTSRPAALSPTRFTTSYLSSSSSGARTPSCPLNSSPPPRSTACE